MECQWAALKMIVKDKEYDLDEHAPVRPGDKVNLKGQVLDKNANPLSGVKVTFKDTITSQDGTWSDTTDDKGWFSIEVTAPDWSIDGLCGEKMRWGYIKAEGCETGQGYSLMWDVSCVAKCDYGTPLNYEVKTDKDKYTINEKAKLEVSITNNGDEGRYAAYKITLDGKVIKEEKNTYYIDAKSTKTITYEIGPITEVGEHDLCAEPI